MKRFMSIKFILLLCSVCCREAQAQPLRSADGQRLVKISVFPEQVVLNGKKAHQALLVTALYSNGVEHDVTSQARFSLKTPGVVEITSQGLVLPLQRGKVQAVVTFERKASTLAMNVTTLDEGGRRLSFLQDISPILTQKGCTGSNCHGSVRGKAGFKLSLFGARPDLDFEQVVNADNGRRINRDKPEASLLLRKPTFQEAHGGGERFKIASLEYQAILEWISSGLEYDAGGPKLEEISIYPAERILVGVGSKYRLIVTGRLSDGSRVDLTQQVRYTSNEEGIATVDEAGEITANRRGETSIMVRTLGQAAVAKVAVVQQAPGPDYPVVNAGSSVDVQVLAKLRKLGIVPSKLADDSVFLRRVYLDTVGALPTIDEARRFLGSNDTEKRSQLIDELLSRPEFVNLWALKFADLFQLGNTGVKGGWQLYRWLRQSLAENKPYDQIVREMLMGTGSFVFDPTVNFYHGLWNGPEGMVTQVSQALLGIRMDCAKCHDHPFERWTQDDFYGMAALFTRLEFKAESYGLFERAIAVRPTRKPSYDYINNNKELLHPKTHQPLTPRFLTGPVVEDPPGKDLRETLADWITSPKNPWFSRAIANRIWKHYLGRGIVEPVDDLRVTNPPSNQALLDTLADRLVREKYDLKTLIKAILNSRTYQVSSVPNATNKHDQTNYSRFYLKRQIAESLYDSMGQAAEVSLKIPGYPPGAKAMSVAVGSPNYFLMTFGKIQFRDQICERDHQPNVAQAMNLVNGETIDTLVTSPGNIVDRLLGRPDLSDRNRIEEIYLAALTRLPTTEELTEVQPKLAGDVVSRKQVFQDLLWAILNTKEFAYIH